VADPSLLCGRSKHSFNFLCDSCCPICLVIDSAVMDNELGSNEMKFEFVYTIDGFLQTFVDVVEAADDKQAEVELKKLVNELVGDRSFHVVLIKSL